MDGNPDKPQHNYPNHNYRGGHRGSVHLQTSVESRIASDAAEMARATRASSGAEEVRAQAVSTPRFASATVVALENNERGQVITEDLETEADEIKNWKRSNDAARLQVELDAAQRQSFELERRGPEVGEIGERAVFRTRAGTWGRLAVEMSSTTATDMLDSRRDTDREERAEDAAWPAKIKKGKESGEEDQDGGRKQSSFYKKTAYSLYGGDERRPSPASVPLPASRVVSLSTQAAIDSESSAMAATTSLWRAGIDPATSEATRPGALLSEEGYYWSTAQRELLEMIRYRQETVKSLLAASEADANTDGGGFVFLEVVFKTIGSHNQRRDRRERNERCAELLRQAKPILGVRDAQEFLSLGPCYTAMEKEARVMAEDMIEDHEQETKELVEKLIELSAAHQPLGLENACHKPHDPMDRIISADKWKRIEVDNDVKCKQNLQEPSHTDPVVRSLLLPDTLPVDGEKRYSRPPCLSPASIQQKRRAQDSQREMGNTTRRASEQEIRRERVAGKEDGSLPGPSLGRASAAPYLPRPPSTAFETPGLSGTANATHLMHETWASYPCPVQSGLDMVDQGLLRGQMVDIPSFRGDETNDSPRQSYAMQSALPSANSFLNSSLLSQKRSASDATERLYLEREVLASIAALAATSVDEARQNENAQASTSHIADVHGCEASILGARTLAKGLKNNSSEVRERTMREREERILKRARQISGRGPPQAAVSPIWGGRVLPQARQVSSRAGPDNCVLNSTHLRTGHSAGHPSRRHDEKQAGSISGDLSDHRRPPLPNSAGLTSAPPLEAFSDKYPRQNPPSGPVLAELARAEAAAAAPRTVATSTEEDSPEERIHQAKMLEVKASGEATDGSPRVQDTISFSSSSEYDLPFWFPRGFLFSLESELKGLAHVFEQDPTVLRQNKEKFLEALKDSCPEIWERWREWEKRGEVSDEDARGKILRQRLEERANRTQHHSEKAVELEEVDGKAKGKPYLSIATSRTITDMELNKEREKAFMEGNMAAFHKIQMAKKKGFEDGVKSVMTQQSSGGGSEDSVRSRAGKKNRYLHTILGAFKSEATGPKNQATEGKTEDESPDAGSLDKERESIGTGNKSEEQNPYLESHDFWALVQFDSTAEFVGPLPRDFPWKSETCDAELFRLGWPNTLSSLKESIEDAVKKELQEMKATKGSPKFSQVGDVGLGFLEEHKISGLTLLWNSRRETILANVGRIMPSGTPCLRTWITERNLQGVLREMSKKTGKHVLLVHTTKRERI